MTGRGVRMLTAAVAAALATLALVACGGGSTNDATTGGSTTESAIAGGSRGGSLRFIRVSYFATSDPTGAVIDSGQKQAAKDLNVDVKWRSPTSTTVAPSEIKRLLENAIASKPDGIIFTDSVPDAFRPTIKSAVKAGIPVVFSNAGFGEAKVAGALSFVGNNETATGRLAGKRLGALGAKHALLATIPPGIPLADQRNNGFIEAFAGKVTPLRIKDFTDPTAGRNAIEAALQKDSSIDAVLSVGTLLTPPMLAVQERLGSRAAEMKWAAIDLNDLGARAVTDGRLDFVLDQQPYLQGYLPVLMLTQYLRLGLVPPVENVETGPVLVDETNVKKIAKLAADKLR
jgi:simple sugar transport system substrate-binding protein